MKLRLKESDSWNFCLIFSRKLSQRSSCTLTRFVVIHPLHLYKTPSQANKPPPLLSTYHTFCCIYATKCVDRSKRHDVRFNWKPLSMSNSVGQTFNPNNTCPGNQFLNMYGGSALGSGKFFGSCLLILFSVQKNFSSLLSYFQIVRQQFSLGHVKEIFELEPEDEVNKQPSGTFCAWEKSISLVDRVWRPRGILNAFWLYLLSPAAISRVWFTDGLW